MDMREDWKAIPGYPDYEASDDGRVRRSHEALRMPGYMLGLKARKADEYLYVSFRPLVHCLVAAAFIGPRPAGAFVNHKDGNKQNNRLENLEYVTPSDNTVHAYETGLHGRGENHGRAKLTDAQVIEIRARYKGQWGSQTKLAKEYGVSQGLISQIVRGGIWMHLPVGEVRGSPDKAHLCGENHHFASVTNDQVREIRWLYAEGGITHQQLAERFSVSRATVSRIVRRNTWQHVAPSRRPHNADE